MYKKRILTLLSISILLLLVACGGNEENTETELVPLEVDFEVPETAAVGETVTLKATVTYGDELVDDADEVQFEIWQQDDEDNSIEIDATNNGDGTYTAETSFDQAGVYEMYAHTTARELHTMPKVSITVE